MNRFSIFVKELPRNKNFWLYLFGSFFLIYTSLILFEYVFFYNSFLPFTKIGSVNISNKNVFEAESTLKSEWQIYANKPQSIGEQKVTPAEIVESINFKNNIEKTLENQRKNFFKLNILYASNSNLEILTKNEEISKLILAANKKIAKPAVNANFVLVNGEIAVSDEQQGSGYDLEVNLKEIESSISKMSKNFNLKIESLNPRVTKEEAISQLENARLAISKDLTITILENKKIIPKKELESWLDIDKVDNNFTFYNEKKVTEFIKSLAIKYDSQTANAELTIKDGRATIFTPSKNGFSLNQESASKKIQAAATGSKNITLEGTSTKPEITEEMVNNLGINELVSVGWSDFVGSPKNRVHNIKTGASKFNGILIKPGEEFSFNTHLGPVDASTGYLPELVIINNKTEPQFGGGLCQVSSTIFRAALNAGLPIIARRAHAYPVKYYRPYGVDATIYLPTPDLIFKNDTGKHMLIQTKISGTKLYFEFYGTKTTKKISFSGNQNATNAVNIVEKVNPYIYDQGVRGRGSFTAVFYRHIYDQTGKLLDNDKFTSKYDSPDKYPH